MSTRDTPPRLFAVFLVVALALSGLTGVMIASAQDAALAFPSGVDVVTSIESPIELPSTQKLSLRLARLTLNPGQQSDAVSVPDPMLVLVESGSLAVIDELGIEADYAAGDDLAIGSAAVFSLRNNGSGPASVLLLTLEPASDGSAASATSTASPGEIAFPGAGATLFQTSISSNLFPADLFLARVTWSAGADTGTHTFPGPVGFLAESNSLSVTGPTGIKGQLKPGKPIVFPAGKPSRQRNTGSDPATVLIAGLIPANTALFPSAQTASRSTATAVSKATAASAGNNGNSQASRPACDGSTAPDAIRIAGDLPYQVWVSWTPDLVIGPNCRAWIFFSAQVVSPDGSLGAKKLYAARFDPESGEWQAASPLPGGQVQFGPSAVVDRSGTVHLVYTDRVDESDSSYGQLLYVHSTGDDGWTDPIPVAPSPTAGHQLSPEIVLDDDDGVHVAWQDQRRVDAAARAASPSNADVFSSDLNADGTWSPPEQISVRSDATTDASRPQLAVDGNRLIAVWSVYTAESGLDTADRIEWSSRPIDGSVGWTKPETLVQRSDAQIGGKLLDLAGNPKGGVALVYGTTINGTSTSLFAQRLQPGATAWDTPILLTQGDRGSFPSVAFAPDGTLVVVYNEGGGDDVAVGALTLAARGNQPGPTTVLAADESGGEGRAFVAIDGDGDPWIVYMHEPAGGAADAIRCIRKADLPRSG